MTGTELRTFRREKDIDQATLAVLLGCRQKDISRWESGKVRMGLTYHHKLLELHEHWDSPEIIQARAEAYLATF